MQGCERDVGAHLVHEHQASRVEGLGDQSLPGRSQELVALARTQSPFFRVNPIRLRSRETVDSLTLTPHTPSRNSHLSESVAAGRASRSASSSCRASWLVLG